MRDVGRGRGGEGGRTPRPGKETPQQFLGKKSLDETGWEMGDLGWRGPLRRGAEGPISDLGKWRARVAATRDAEGKAEAIR